MEYQKYLTQLKKQNIILAEAAACKLFCEQGIESVKMTDVARKAQVSIASLYRYFDTKEKLVIACAVKMWGEVIQSILPNFKDNEFASLCGYDKVCRIFRVYKKLCDGHKEFVRFVALFDSYCLNNKIEPSKLADYEQIITSLYRYFSDAFDDLFAQYTKNSRLVKAKTSNMGSLGEILSQDDFASSREVDVMTDIFLSYLKA